MHLPPFMLVLPIRGPKEIQRVLSVGSAGFWLLQYSGLGSESDEGRRRLEWMEVDFHHGMSSKWRLDPRWYSTTKLAN